MVFCIIGIFTTETVWYNISIITYSFTNEAAEGGLVSLYIYLTPGLTRPPYVLVRLSLLKDTREDSRNFYTARYVNLHIKRARLYVVARVTITTASPSICNRYFACFARRKTTKVSVRHT